MRRRRLALTAIAAVAGCALSGCASARPNVYGRHVTLIREAGAVPAKGELLAIENDRVWLYTRDGVRDFETATVREVRVERHREGRTARRIGLIGGLVSAVALSAACASVEGNSGGSCAVIGGVMGGIWAGTGLAVSAGLNGSAERRLPAGDASLPSYARFPAGLPRAVKPESLARKASTGR